MVVQATFGIDIYQKGETDPADLLHGRQFHSDTGLQGVVESDFFTWPTEVGGLPFLRTLARRVDRFDWPGSPSGRGGHPVRDGDSPGGAAPTGGVLHSRLAGADDGSGTGYGALEQHVLDPACGSGTFIAEAVAHFFEAAKQSGGLHQSRCWTVCARR